MLRIMGWLCTSTDLYRNSTSQMVIVTGPNQDLAIKLIKRLKGIFEPRLGLYFTNKETVLELNGCMIEAYPSNHLDSFRSLTNPKFIFIDEADMFRKGEQEDVRDVSERPIYGIILYSDSLVNTMPDISSCKIKFRYIANIVHFYMVLHTYR